MRFIDYAKRRKDGFSHKASSLLSHRDIGDTVVYVAACVFLVVFSLYTAAETIEQGRADAADRATALAATKVDKLEKLVVACLQGGAINVSGVAFTCRAESLGVRL